jgi:hypothetical protein
MITLSVHYATQGYVRNGNETAYVLNLRTALKLVVTLTYRSPFLQRRAGGFVGSETILALMTIRRTRKSLQEMNPH